MPKKRDKKSVKASKSEDYVFGHPLFADTAVIPPQKLFSDTAYWYDKKKREKLWNSNIPKADKDFYSPFKGSPYAFVDSLPDWYSDHISEVQMQEFEFSDNQIIRTMFSEVIDDRRHPDGPEFGTLQWVSRDVVTGSFQLKNGKITGTAYTLTRQSLNDGRPLWLAGEFSTAGPFQDIYDGKVWSSQDVFQWQSEQGIPVTGKTGLEIAYPYDGEWDNLDPIRVPSDSQSAGGISINKFFPDGWELNPFGNNLI